MILNGIDDVATKQDLVDRSLIVSLSAIPDNQRRSEQALFADFRTARPALLGALCDAISAAIRNVGSVAIPALPRMADFATWIIAAEEFLPWTPGDFMKNYLNARKHAIEIAIEGDVVAPFIIKLIDLVDPWNGTASNLLSKLDALVPDHAKKSRQWPKSTSALANRLRRAANFLRAGGIEVVFSREAGTGRRLIEIHRRLAVTTVTPVTLAPPREGAGTLLNEIELVTAVSENAPGGNTAPSQNLIPQRGQTDGCDASDAPIPTMSRDVSGDLDLDV